MFDLHSVDLIVIVVYFLIITALGIGASRLVSTASDYFMPRKFGKAMLIMHGFGSGTHSDQAVSVASKTYVSGLSGIWYQWLWLFVTPFFWIIAPIMRRFRAITIADVFETRYDRSMSILFAIVGMMQLMVTIGVMLKGTGAIITAVFGSWLNPDIAIAVMTLLFVVYGMAGGLSAAIITDFIQGLLTVVFSFLLLPFVLNAVGGMEGLHQSIKDPQMWSLIAPAEIGLFYVVMIAVNGLFGIVTQPHVMGLCATGKSEINGRYGFTYGNFIKRICTIAWTLTGFAAIAYFSGREQVDPDLVFGLMAKEFLPAVMPGLLGIFVASLLASVMSSCDSLMVASSGLFTENIYRPFFPHKTEKQYLAVGRIVSLFIVLGGLVFAYQLPGVVAGLEIFWKIGPMLGIAFWLGLFWRNMTSSGAWASAIAGFFIWWLTEQPWFIGAIADWDTSLADILLVGNPGAYSVYLPWQMLFYLTFGVLFGIVVSVFTKKNSKEKLDNFYNLIKTPVEDHEPPAPRPCVLPSGTPPKERKKIFPSADSLELYLPSRTTWVGFVITTAAVLLLIFIFIYITQ
jgi:Na+/proline symporter